MASSNKVCRLSSKIHSLAQRLSKKNVNVSSIPSSPIKSSLPSSPTPRFNPSFRVPEELSSCVSMFPLHSAIASSRLVSSLSLESISWGLVPQGAIVETDEVSYWMSEEVEIIRNARACIIS